MSAPRTRKALVALLAAAVALALASSSLAGHRGSISTTATTVTSGDTFIVNACVATAGDGGYLLVKGPNTFSQELFFGPVTGCTGVSVATVGWAAGKYRINGYEFTTKGTSGLGSVTVTIVAP
jgi:hypothetical protein